MHGSEINSKKIITDKRKKCIFAPEKSSKIVNLLNTMNKRGFFILKIKLLQIFVYCYCLKIKTMTRKKIIWVLPISILFLFACNKQCGCKLWTNGLPGDEYPVTLVNDGSTCKDQSTINVKDSLWDGIECKDK